MIDDPGPPGADQDWRLYVYSPPVPFGWRTIEIWRKDMGNETKFLTPETSHPAMNVAGLWWRPA